MITRKVVYGAALCLFLAAIGATLAAIIIPDWISWDTDTVSVSENPPHPPVDQHLRKQPPAAPVRYTYGLFRRCSSITEACRPFPTYDECKRVPDSHNFCPLWRTTGFLMSLSVVVSLAALVAFVVILVGGKQKRTHGWRVLVILLLLSAAAQAAAMAIVQYLFENDARFFPGWQLDRSFVLCCVSWGLEVVVAAGVVAMAYTVPEEGGYELIPDTRRGL